MTFEIAMECNGMLRREGGRFLGEIFGGNCPLIIMESGFPFKDREPARKAAAIE